MRDGEQRILLLPGDGIGPEITAELEKVIAALQQKGIKLQVDHGLIGGAAYEDCGKPLPDTVLAQARSCDAILMGAVGTPRYDVPDPALRPEAGLLSLRRALDLFANLRPVRCHPALANASTLRREVIAGLDIMIVRELTGGIYFGTPRGVSCDNAGKRRAVNTLSYHEDEIRRIAQVAFKTAMSRNCRLCSVDKANVLEVSMLWREVVEEVAQDYPKVTLTHLYVDNAAMQLVRNPAQFDVILTSNMFGDILSDLASMLTGSIGLLPSASLNAQTSCGLYEPVHGSAPDIAGTGSANPLAMISSLAMALRYSLNQVTAADWIEHAISAALTRVRTADINSDMPVVSTAKMGDTVVDYLLEG